MEDTISKSIKTLSDTIKSHGEKLESLETKFKEVENKLSQHLEALKKSTKLVVPKLVQVRL